MTVLIHEKDGVTVLKSQTADGSHGACECRVREGYWWIEWLEASGPSSAAVTLALARAAVREGQSRGFEKGAFAVDGSDPERFKAIARVVRRDKRVRWRSALFDVDLRERTNGN